MKWISVDTRYPENDDFVLVWQVYHDDPKATRARIMQYKHDTWYGPGFGVVTHWMPLPLPPNEE